MRHATSFAALYWPVLLFTVLLFGCRKTDNSSPQNPPNPPPPPPPSGGSVQADTLSNHLRFFASAKKQGSPPAAPTGNNALQLSIRDTLYLADEFLQPIKFLHKDTTKNVAGAFVQVVSSSGAASFYYDVPELKQMAASDTVSVIMIGLNPSGLKVPQTFALTLTPYDKNGQPLAKSTKMVNLTVRSNNPAGRSSSCGLVLPSGEVWDWLVSFVLPASGVDTFSFYSDPFKVHGSQGQDIEGSCCNGHSNPFSFCIGLTRHNRSLHFNTYYQIIFEDFIFFSPNRFSRQTMEDAPVPVPSQSNFCSFGPGIVLPGLKHTKYEGIWTTQPVTLPPDLQHLTSTDKLQLILQDTSSTGTGFGNPGGVIHRVDCNIGGLLILIQLDREGRGKHLIKVYQRRRVGESIWAQFVG